MQPHVKLSLLLDYYGEFLTARQRSLLEAYVNEDLSLAEISEREGISRQGVHDALKRAQKTLLSMEGKLGLIAREQSIYERLLGVYNALNELDVPNESTEGKAELLSELAAICKAWEEQHGV